MIDRPTRGQLASWRASNVHGARLTSVSVSVLFAEIDALTAELAEARLQRDCRDGQIRMTVDRLEGLVEGQPTHEGNFLQRIDELRGIEARCERLIEPCAFHKTPPDFEHDRNEPEGAEFSYCCRECWEDDPMDGNEVFAASAKEALEKWNAAQRAARGEDNRS